MSGLMTVESIGWLATAVFVSSYLCSSARALRAMQMAGAIVWMVYGLLVQAPPVFVANLLVLSAAAWTMARGRRPAE
jgi:hypothetical protein